jgi:hypothetical protein
LHEDTCVTLARASWLVVVGICLVATVILFTDGYNGYAIVVGAVGASAAVNLF